MLSLIIFLEIRLQKRLKANKIRNEEDQKVMGYIEQIKKLKSDKKEVKERLNKLNQITKNYLHEFFHVSLSASYSEIIPELTKKKNTKYNAFCQTMLNEYYSDEKISEAKVSYLIDLLIKTIKEDKKILQENKREEKLKEGNKEKKKENSVIKKPLAIDKPIVKNTHTPNTINEPDIITPNPDFKKFFSQKRESEKIMNSFFKNKEMMFLSRIPLKMEQEIIELFQKKPHIHKELKKLSASLNIAYESFKEIFNQEYQKGDKEKKKELRKMSEEWNREKKNIFSQINNPIRRHMIEFYLLDKYSQKFMQIKSK